MRRRGLVPELRPVRVRRVRVDLAVAPRVREKRRRQQVPVGRDLGARARVPRACVCVCMQACMQACMWVCARARSVRAGEVCGQGALMRLQGIGVALTLPD